MKYQRKGTAAAIGLGLALAADAQAFCTPGEQDTCWVDGQSGTRVCGDDGIYGPCDVPPAPPVPYAEVEAAYKILTVVYAPPGRNGGSNSSVSYGAESSLGSTTSLTDSFSDSLSVTATAGVVTLTSASGTFTYSYESSDAEVAKISKVESTTISMGGPDVDGVDHDRDQIWLWLGPTFEVSMPSEHAVTWSIDPKATMNLQYVYVGDLKNPSQMAPGVAANLAAHGITEEDYADILAADPLADPEAGLDPDRYAPLQLTFPYQPPYAPGDPSPTVSFQSAYAASQSATHTSKHGYKVGLTWKSGLDLIGFSLSSTSELSFSDTYSKTDDTGVNERATVTVGGPAYGYTGPTTMGVYYDTLYKSFAFAPLDPGSWPFASGYLIAKDKEPLGGVVVAAVDAEGTAFQAVTAEDGRFVLYGDPVGKVTFSPELALSIDPRPTP